MHRFFIKTEIKPTIQIDGQDAVHILRVLRLTTGDEITVCDGKGKECEASIEQVYKDRLTCSCGPVRNSLSEPNTLITLFQGLPKGSKMETVIQKSVELGVFDVVPLLTSRCVVQPKESFSGKIDRWQKISEEAAKQSRRGIIPVVHPLCPVKNIDPTRFDLTLIAYENEQTVSLKSALKTMQGKRVALIIGPEGGLSEEEVASLIQKGAVSVSLGPRILRTETAGMAAIAQILYEVDL